MSTYEELRPGLRHFKTTEIGKVRNPNGTYSRITKGDEYFETKLGLIREDKWTEMAYQAVKENSDLLLMTPHRGMISWSPGLRTAMGVIVTSMGISIPLMRGISGLYRQNSLTRKRLICFQNLVMTYILTLDGILKEPGRSSLKRRTEYLISVFRTANTSISIRNILHLSIDAGTVCVLDSVTPEESLELEISDTTHFAVFYSE